MSRVIPACTALLALLLAAPATAQFAPLAGVSSTPLPADTDGGKAAPNSDLEAAFEGLREHTATRTRQTLTTAGLPDTPGTDAHVLLTSRPASLTPTERLEQRFRLQQLERATEAAHAGLRQQAAATGPAADPALHLQLATVREGLRALREQIRENLRVENPTRRLRTLPALRSNDEAEAYFGSDFEAVGSAALVFPGSADGALFVEFYVDNANLGPLGYARMGFGAFVQSDADPADDAEEVPGAPAEEPAGGAAEASAEAFLNNGGNAALYTALPLLDLRALPTNGSDGHYDLNLNLLLLPRVAAQFSQLSGPTEDPTWNAEAGLQARLSYATFEGVFRVFGAAHGGAVTGSADFYRDLWVERPFGYFRFDLGVDIAQRLRVSVRRALWGPTPLRDVPLALSVQLLKIPGND